MKTRLLRSLAAMAAILLLLLPLRSTSAKTTTLLSEDFSSEQFPPSGWTVNSLFSYGTYNTGWHQSSGGYNGFNGSAVAQTYVGYYYTQYPDAPPYACYAPNPPYIFTGTLPDGTYTSGTYIGPLSMTTPSVDVSSYPAIDTQFVDFDLYAPEDYWEYYAQQSYGSNLGLKITVSEGETVLKTIDIKGSQIVSDETFVCDTSLNGPLDPSGGFTAPTYWRHYHIALPQGIATQQVTFTVDMEYPTTIFSCHSWYTPDVAFDNIAITDVSPPDILTLLGPKSLDFGLIPYNQTGGPLYTKFTNHSTRTITLSNYAITGLNAGDFKIVYSPLSIAVGDTDSIGITYTPQTAGAETAQLTLNTDADIPTSINIPLAGYGVQPKISIPAYSTPLFAHTRVRFGGTVYATVLITSTGLTTLHISPLSFFSGDHPEMYSFVRIPIAIASDQTDSMIIAFSPTIEGQMPANLNIVSDASNGTQVVRLDGIGVLARLDINNSYRNAISINLDSVLVGTDTCAQVTLFNPGSDTLAIEKNFFSSGDYDFSLTPLTGADTLIPPNMEKSVQVCFRPLKRGYRTAELRILTNIPLTYQSPRQDTSQFTVLFTGTGVPVGNFQITGPDIADTTMVGTSICQTDTLWNIGQASLTVTSLSVSDTGEFAINPPALPLVLAPGSYHTFTVCADPKAIDNRLSTITGIGFSGERVDTATWPLDVFGRSNCTSDSIAQNFPPYTCVGDTSQATILVTNCGNIPTSYTATITGPNAADFAIVGLPTSQIESENGIATYLVDFIPSTNTIETAQLNITGGAGATVMLFAAGGAATIVGSGSAPTTDVGSTSNFSVTVRDTGTCGWTPGVPQVSAPFSYVSGGTTPITAGNPGTLNFSFSPTSEGTFNQTVSFPSATGVSIPGANVMISGSSVNSSVSEVSSSQGYSLDQNYPNPFGNKSQVEITLPVTSDVRLVITDVKGETVETVLDQRMNAGTFEVTLNASRLPSGTYFYQMTAGTVTLTRQMTIEK